MDTSFRLFLVPSIVFVFLATFQVVLIFLQRKYAKKYSDGESKTVHSERIYKDFDMYLKTMLAVIAAFGFVRLKFYADNPEVAREALIHLGALSLFLMFVFSIFVMCHQASKVRTWIRIEWRLVFFWQETWACLAMWILSSAVWYYSHVW
jgi:hypothetical protein